MGGQVSPCRELPAAENTSRSGRLFPHICRITTVRGEAKLIEIVAYPLPPDGELWSVLALDLGEQQRRLEELLQLQQALELQQQHVKQQARSLAEAHAALARLSTMDTHGPAQPAIEP